MKYLLVLATLILAIGCAPTGDSPSSPSGPTPKPGPDNKPQCSIPLDTSSVEAAVLSGARMRTYCNLTEEEMLQIIEALP